MKKEDRVDLPGDGDDKIGLGELLIFVGKGKKEHKMFNFWHFHNTIQERGQIFEKVVSKEQTMITKLS